LVDYYAILGLDHEASPESIKLAYRRLARENHPDHNTNSTEAEKSALSVRMTELNGAYAVLSDAARRREYDAQLRVLTSLAASTTLRASKTAAKASAKPAASHRGQTSHDAELTMLREFSKQLRSHLQSNRKDFSWEEVVFEGFDWGLQSVSWSSHYCVATRAFPLLDPAAAKKFSNYSEVVITRFNRNIRKSHFLFLLPFQQMIQSESVSIELNRLISSENREPKLDVPIGVVLFDSKRGRTMRVGGKSEEKHFEDLLMSLGSVLVHS
jgi:curved DNA-binding protein CbpA